MKKVIFIVAALMAVFSGIAAVSAFEGHMVDVKVHVENAIGVKTADLDLGTRFPQETVETDITWGMTKSFFEQNRLSTVFYSLFYELKPIAGHDPVPAPPYLTDYFQPLNPFIYHDPELNTEIALAAGYNTPPTPTTPTLIGTGSLAWLSSGDSPGDLCDTLHLHVDIPVFEGYYNSLTDAQFKPANWTFSMLYDGVDDAAVGVTAPQFVLVPECICGSIIDVPHADLGINIKIQVTAFDDHDGDPKTTVWPDNCEWPEE